MSSNEYRKSIAYSKEDREEEIQRLKKESDELISKADDIRRELDKLQEEEYYLQNKLMVRQYGKDRTIDKIHWGKKKAEKEKLSNELNKLSKQIGENRRRLDELEGKPTINLIEAYQLRANGREAI